MNGPNPPKNGNRRRHKEVGVDQNPLLPPIKNVLNENQSKPPPPPQIYGKVLAERPVILRLLQKYEDISVTWGYRTNDGAHDLFEQKIAGYRWFQEITDPIFRTIQQANGATKFIGIVDHIVKYCGWINFVVPKINNPANTSHKKKLRKIITDYFETTNKGGVNMSTRLRKLDNELSKLKKNRTAECIRVCIKALRNVSKGKWGAVVTLATNKTRRGNFQCSAL